METKICSKCKRELTSDNFVKGNGKDGLSYRCKICVKQCYQENKENILAQRKQYYQENKDKVSDYKKQYASDNKDKISDYRKQYYQNNKENICEHVAMFREENKDIIAERKKRYTKENPEKHRAVCQRRRAMKQSLPATLTEAQWEEIKEKYGSKCAYCGKELPLEQEHFIPVSKGGEYSRRNIIPACHSCNSSKNGKGFLEWYPKYKYYSKERELFILRDLKLDESVGG